MTKPAPRSRPLTRAAALENRAFLKILARTGNVRLAAKTVGVAHTTFLHRRRRHPHFAHGWDAALAVAQARLGGFEDTGANALAAAPLAEQVKGKGEGPLVWRYKKPKLDPLPAHANARVDPLPQRGEGKEGPLRRGEWKAPSTASGPPHPRGEEFRSRHRTVGGEVHVTRLRDGRVQVRRAQPGKLTREAEQAFLSALSATCNVTLAAAAVGVAPRAFYRRKMTDPAFAREYRLALERGYERIEMALLEAGLAGSHEHDDWRRNDPPAMPPMSVNQGLQLMYLHQKEARLKAEPWPIKRLRGESSDVHCLRLAIMAAADDQRARDAFDVAEASRFARGEEASGPAGEAVREALGLPDDFGLPDLAQVTGWSRADAGAFGSSPHPTQPGERQDPDVALFGGWRILEMEQWLEWNGDGWTWRESSQPECRGHSGPMTEEEEVAEEAPPPSSMVPLPSKTRGG